MQVLEPKRVCVTFAGALGQSLQLTQADTSCNQDGKTEFTIGIGFGARRLHVTTMTSGQKGLSFGCFPMHLPAR